MLSEGFTCTIINTNVNVSGSLFLTGIFYSKMYPNGYPDFNIEAGATVRVNVIKVENALRYYLSGDITYN